MADCIGTGCKHEGMQQMLAEKQAEIERLRKVWEDTRTQRDELLAHLTRKEPLPAWAVEWVRVYRA